MAFARTNGIVLHYETRGAAEAPALVFSNSLGTDFRIWDQVADKLADDFRLILYDKRGHGLSDAPPQPYRMEEHVEDLASLLKHLNVSSAVVAGLSVGGMIAQGLAYAHPELVRALVLCSTAPKVGTEAMWNDRINAINNGGFSSMAEAILSRWFAPSYRSPENPDFMGYANMLVRTPPDGYAGTCAAIRDADFTSAVRRLHLPVLCLVGDEDCSTPPELVRELASLIPGAHFTIVEGAGHILCVEQPEAIAKLIREFVTSLA